MPQIIRVVITPTVLTEKIVTAMNGKDNSRYPKSFINSSRLVGLINLLIQQELIYRYNALLLLT